MTQRTDENDEGYGRRKVCSWTKMMILNPKRSHGQYMCQQPR